MGLAVSHDTEQLIFALAAAAEAKDHLTERHPRRVANTSWRLGKRLGLQESDLVALSRRTCPRHWQDRRARCNPPQARAAERR